MKEAPLNLLAEYLHTIEKELVAGNATEHTHRSALKTLIEGLAEGIIATNEPTHIECGAPDFVVTKGVTTIGYIEAKDVGKSLDEAQKTEQLKRYRDSLTNLILTDYLEFRWYVDGWSTKWQMHLGSNHARRANCSRFTSKIPKNASVSTMGRYYPS